MFGAAEKLSSVGLKLSRERRNLSFGFLFPGQHAELLDKTRVFALSPVTTGPEERGRHCLLFESVEAPPLGQLKAVSPTACCSRPPPFYRNELPPLDRQPRGLALGSGWEGVPLQ